MPTEAMPAVKIAASDTSFIAWLHELSGKFQLPDELALAREIY